MIRILREEEALVGANLAGTDDCRCYGGRTAGNQRDVSRYQAGYVFLCLHYYYYHGVDQYFPARKYTKYISWDILITIACAFAISKAMVNSGVADCVAGFIIGLSDDYGPHVLLAILFVITNLFTELITNNAAAALAFPLALSISAQLGVSPTPFFVVICMAASASFSTPIGYQTNLIVQGIGNYKFTDFVRIGLPLNIITFLISVILIPLIWNF